MSCSYLTFNGKHSTFLLGQRPPPSYDQYYHLLSQELPVNLLLHIASGTLKVKNYYNCFFQKGATHMASGKFTLRLD